MSLDKCNHCWVPSSPDDDGQPVFKLNRLMGSEPVVHVGCEYCGLRTWFTEKQLIAIPANESWSQERPGWCPHHDCFISRRVMDDACAGRLPDPVDHDGVDNIYRICMNGVLPGGEIFDLQVNDTDLEYLRWLFDSLDGKKTSWLSKR